MKHVNNLPYLQALGLVPTPPVKQDYSSFYVLAAVLIAGVVIQQIRISQKVQRIADLNRRLNAARDELTAVRLNADATHPDA